MSEEVCLRPKFIPNQAYEAMSALTAAKSRTEPNVSVIESAIEKIDQMSWRKEMYVRPDFSIDEAIETMFALSKYKARWHSASHVAFINSTIGKIVRALSSAFEQPLRPTFRHYQERGGSELDEFDV